MLGIGATVAVGCSCMLYYLLTYDYLTIRSPYVGYEFGEADVIIRYIETESKYDYPTVQTFDGAGTSKWRVWNAQGDKKPSDLPKDYTSKNVKRDMVGWYRATDSGHTMLST